MKRIRINKDACKGCLSCVLACMAEHSDVDKKVSELDLSDAANESRNHIVLDSCSKPVPIFCRHCDEPECVITCMSGAMTKDEVTGIVTYNGEKCASCFMCIMSCPYGVLKPSDNNKKVVMKCDLCDGRTQPACVENCPTGAIYIDGGEEQ